VLAEDIRDRRAWKRKDLSPPDWLVPLPQRCLDELDAAARQVRSDPLPPVLLDPAQFALGACAEVMAQVRDTLRAGIGLAVLDRVPVERYTGEENRALAWLLGSLLGRLVAQKWDGTMIYDVHDTGRALEYGVRRSVTNLDLTFHTDAPWLDLPPELVGLYCINPALEGGVSRFVSLCSVHNELRRRHPERLARLYRPFPWDRQAEHAQADGQTTRRPIFRYAGGAFTAAFNEKLVATGADLAESPLDARAMGRVHHRARPGPVHQQPPVRAQPHRLQGLRRAAAQAPPDPPLDARGRPPNVSRLSALVDDAATDDRRLRAPRPPRRRVRPRRA